jgi:hypothetical protein
MNAKPPSTMLVLAGFGLSEYFYRSAVYKKGNYGTA